MTSSPPEILIVDDDCDLGTMLGGALRPTGRTRSVQSASEALRIVHNDRVDLILTDLRMPQMNGVELCRQVRSTHPHIPVLVMTAFGSQDTVTETRHAGAIDCLLKPCDLTELREVVRRTLRAPVAVHRPVPMPSLTGVSRPMSEVRRRIHKFARFDSSVLITGETGTGKELVARALHDLGPRRAGPMVTVNCAALPAELLESELFGHAIGAFTGAQRSRRGLMEEAAGGTLFLDEVGELPLRLQPKLLRVLQERRTRRLGENREVELDVRIVAATNRNLRSEVQDGRFRADLLFRLRVFELALPPLRTRRADLPLLIEAASKRVVRRLGLAPKAFTDRALARLFAYDWPGNVRELENCVEYALVMADGFSVTVEDLPPDVVVESSPPEGSSSATEGLTLEHAERAHIHRVLMLEGRNKAATARVLGIDRKTLQRKIAKYHLDELPHD
ncbi:MAG: sigma-54 dependent transcriptional regulator [Myxococcota bacterium]